MARLFPTYDGIDFLHDHFLYVAALTLPLDASSRADWVDAA